MSAEPSPHFLLLPGLDGTGAMFAPFCEVLEEAGAPFTVVRLPPERLTSYEELAERVAPQIDPARSILVAESFSGPLALELAARRPPGSVAGVVLVASFIQSPVTRVLRLVPWSFFFRSRPPEKILRYFLLDSDVAFEHVVRMCGSVSSVPAAVLANRLELIFKADATRRLAACPAPLLYLQATRDRLVGPRSLERIRAVRGDVIVRRVDAPHLLLQTAPRLAWEAIQAELI